MFQFLGTIALLQAVYYALVFAGLGLLLQWLPRIPYLRFDLVISFLVGVHLFVWLYGWSIMNDLGFYLSVLLPLGISYGIVFLGAAFHKFLRDRLTSFPLDSRLLLGGLIVFAIGLKLGVVLYGFSTESLILGLRANKGLRGTNTKASNLVPYPFTLSMKDGINRFSLLLPSVPSKDTIVVIVLDALRSDYVGRRMHGVPVTPNLDQLAEQGSELHRYYVQATWTKPSTASLFTGRYVREHGVMTGGRIRRGEFKGHVLPSDVRTLAERLTDVGYRNYGSVMTSHIGRRYQFDQGFEHWFGPGRGYEGDFSSLQRALFWLLREKPSKSFLYLHLHGPHHPYRMAYYNRAFLSRTSYYSRGGINPPGRFTFGSSKLAKRIKNGQIELNDTEVQYLRTLYAAQLNLYDRRLVGPFLNTLKTLDVLRESFLVVAGDHGEELYEHGGYAHGNNLYEVTINPGMVVRFPASGSVPDGLGTTTVESIDLTATLLDYAGVSPQGLSGTSFYRGLTNNEFRYALSEQTRNNGIESAAVVDYPRKLIHEFGSGNEQFYNLRDDPGETENRIDATGPIDELRQIIFRTLGTDTRPDRPSVPLKDITETEMKNLRGLGYVE